MGARAEEFHTPVFDNRAYRDQRRPQIVHGLRDGVTHASDDLNGVSQQFFVYVRGRTDFGDHRGGLVAEVRRRHVDESELPLDAECRTLRTREVDPNRR